MLKYNVPAKAIIFLIFTLPLFLLTACKDCSKKVPCPGYEDATLDAWFPYADKQVLVFKSNTNLFDTLQLFLADSTIAYDYNTGFGSQNKGCFANKSFATTKKDSSYYATFSITLNSVQDAYSTTQKRSAVIYFKDKYFNGQDLSDNGFLNFSLADGTNATPQTLMNYSLNGKIYPLAQSIFADSSSVKNSGVYKIIYAKNNGIIAYESSPGGVTWIKQ